MLLLLGSFFIAVRIFESQRQLAFVPTSTTTTTLPIAQNTVVATTTSAYAFSVPSTDGKIIPTRNFLSDSSVAKDEGDETYYALSGGLDPSQTGSPYQIGYDGDTQTFYILLYKNPVDQYRLQAQQELEQKLGISAQDMCRLDAFVVTMPGVADAYLHTNLKFSFCRGATALP